MRTKTKPELIFQQFADGPHAAISQVINVVDFAFPDLEIDEVADDFDNVLSRQSSLLQGQIQKQFLVQLQSPDRRKVIALGVQEQIVEERPGSFDRRRLSRPETPVDLDHRLFLRHRSVPSPSVSRMTGVEVAPSR